MCIVSMVGDHFDQKWYPKTTTTSYTYNLNPVSREEFDALKKEVEEMKELLIMAKIIDEKTGQKDCEMEEKIATLKKVADLVGVDLSDIFKTD